MHSVYIVVEHMAKKIKRNEWIYNGYTWTNPDGRSLTRDTSSKPQATSGKQQVSKYMQFYIDLASKNYKL